MLQFDENFANTKGMGLDASYSSAKIRAWAERLPKYIPTTLSEVNLWSLGEGDVLVAATKNTRYEFSWSNNGTAVLTTNRNDGQEARRVRLLGCSMDKTNAFRAGVVFCGGNLDFVSDEGTISHHTSPVQSLEIRKHNSLG